MLLRPEQVFFNYRHLSAIFITLLKINFFFPKKREYKIIFNLNNLNQEIPKQSNPKQIQKPNLTRQTKNKQTKELAKVCLIKNGVTLNIKVT